MTLTSQFFLDSYVLALLSESKHLVQPVSFDSRTNDSYEAGSFKWIKSIVQLVSFDSQTNMSQFFSANQKHSVDSVLWFTNQWLLWASSF